MTEDAFSNGMHSAEVGQQKREAGEGQREFNGDEQEESAWRGKRKW